MATHSSVLASRIPGMVGPDGLPSMGSHRVGHDWSNLACTHINHLGGVLRNMTPCNSMDCSPPGSSVYGIFQARILECVATSYSSAWKWKVKVKLLSRVQLLVTSWTPAYQAPPSMGFSRQEYWSGVPWPSPSVDINLSKPWEIVKDREAWCVAVHGVVKSWTPLRN